MCQSEIFILFLGGDTVLCRLKVIPLVPSPSPNTQSVAKYWEIEYEGSRNVTESHRDVEGRRPVIVIEMRRDKKNVEI